MGANLDLDDVVYDHPQAKAELAQLRQTIESMREALERIATDDVGAKNGTDQEAARLSREIARDALLRAEKPDPPRLRNYRDGDQPHPAPKPEGRTCKGCKYAYMPHYVECIRCVRLARPDFFEPAASDGKEE